MKKIINCILIILFVVGISVDISMANSAPPNNLSIIVEDIEEDIYVDLLLKEGSYFHYSSHVENNNIDKEKANIIKNYSKDGYVSASFIDIFEDHIPENIAGKVEKGKRVFEFNSMFMPDVFKIIVVRGNNDILVSDEFSIKEINAEIKIDLEKGRYIKTPALILGIKDYGKYFLKTCSLTLLIEGLLLILFRFSIKKNWKVLLGVNILTQLLLYLLIIFFGLYINIIFYELIILILEIFAYDILLKDENRPRYLRFLYAIVANIASFYIGIKILMI